LSSSAAEGDGVMRGGEYEKTKEKGPMREGRLRKMGPLS